MVSQVQSVLFEKKYWNIAQAKRWLHDNGFVSSKVDVTEHELRFRQHEPSEFKRFRTKKEKTGITLVIGFK